MLGTINGFSLTYPQTAGSGGGGGGQNLSWRRDQFPQTVAFAAGLVLNLSGIPLHETGIFIWSQGQWLHPDNYTYNSLTHTITILFSADPVTDTDTGVWEFLIAYEYEL
jgi:hypothetical protein